jgi:cyclic pyranopterin phosphate synthase
MSENICHPEMPHEEETVPRVSVRVIDYLRISITDQCDAQCLYCMPEGYKGCGRSADHLTINEILRVVRAAVDLGFCKFRLTGGEPLIRADVAEIIGAMAAIPGVEYVGLTTNGARLAKLAPALHKAGLRTLNISLDALDAQIYRHITGGDINSVLAGIHAAIAAGFERVKLNCVLMRGVNETQIWPLVLFAAEHGLPLRFIELMPITTANVLTASNFMTIADAVAVLQQHDKLISHSGDTLGFGPAKYFQLAKIGARIGFIGSITSPNFCEACNKLRLTADGMLRLCLGDPGEIDLRDILRHESTDESVREKLLAAIARKPAKHSFQNQFHPCRPMTAIGG